MVGSLILQLACQLKNDLSIITHHNARPFPFPFSEACNIGAIVRQNCKFQRTEHPHLDTPNAEHPDHSHSIVKDCPKHIPAAEGRKPRMAERVNLIRCPSIVQKRCLKRTPAAQQRTPSRSPIASVALPSLFQVSHTTLAPNLHLLTSRPEPANASSDFGLQITDGP